MGDLEEGKRKKNVKWITNHQSSRNSEGFVLRRYLMMIGSQGQRGQWRNCWSDEVYTYTDDDCALCAHFVDYRLEIFAAK